MGGLGVGSALHLATGWCLVAHKGLGTRTGLHCQGLCLRLKSLKLSTISMQRANPAVSKGRVWGILQTVKHCSSVKCNPPEVQWR